MWYNKIKTLSDKRRVLMSERLVFHIDVNSAFLSWEAARRVSAGQEDIRLIPSAIGGDRDKRTGVILAKSIPAKKYGVKTGEPVGMALKNALSFILQDLTSGFMRNARTPLWIYAGNIPPRLRSSQ